MVTKVACIGECMVEMVQEPNGSYGMGYGGDVANTGVYLARLLQTTGLSVAFISAIGDDPYSDQMRHFLAQEKLGTKHLISIPNTMAGLYFIQTDDQGERHFHYYRTHSAATQMFLGEHGQILLNSLSDYQWLYLTGISLSILDKASLDQLEARLVEARNQGQKVVFDSNYRPQGWSHSAEAKETFKRFLKLTDIALITLADEDLLYDKTDIASTIKRLKGSGVREGVIKLGAEGCVAFTDQQQHQIYAERVALPVDTTAAGDAFNAAYLAARIKGIGIVESAQAGNQLAAQVIQHPGAIIDADLLIT
jgi:2-dehydro-3-deoxygluconokinase